MEPKAKPIRKRGERNIYCPFYSDCLDYVVNHLWQSWSCSECPHRSMRSITQCECKLKDTSPCYDLPPHVVREGGENSSDCKGDWTVLISATYICPVRSLAGLEPPEPVWLGQAARVAKGLGLARLTLPVLEKSLLGTSRAKVGFLEGLIQGLEPKEHVETWLKEIHSGKLMDGINDFIDISKQEYLDDPHTHLPRLWDHLQESSWLDINELKKEGPDLEWSNPYLYQLFG